jgi:hypothetical protein
MANAMPAADVDVTAGLVRELLADQHPDLAGLPISFLARGWDNALAPRSALDNCLLRRLSDYYKTVSAASATVAP